MAKHVPGTKYQFFLGGTPAGPRRKNAPNPNGVKWRKFYPRVTKEQRGTPMESMIKARRADLAEQFNATHPLGPGVMHVGQSTGALNTAWTNIARRMTTGKSVSRYSVKNNIRLSAAKTALIGLTDVSFGADPKNH